MFAAATEVIRINPRIKFLLIGGGEWRKRFERIVDERGIRANVVFAGLVPPAQVPRYVGVMDALAHLSRREGLPRALPQAMAAGKPVVAFDCDGASEVCIDGETGRLLPPGDLSALTRCLIGLASEPAQGAALGERGRAFVKERFPVERMLDDLHQLYSNLLHP